MEYIICHYHEIALKGKNRKFFEEGLVENIKKALPESCFEFVKRISGRILIKLNEKGFKKKKKIKESLKNVFGIANFCFADSCKQTIGDIKTESLKILEEKKFKSFKISTKRSKKEFPLTSQEVNEKVGELIIERLNKKVDLGKPGVTLFIEIVQDYAFLYLSKIEGLGGLPVGVSGKGAVLLSGGIDSPVAAFLAMKRGIRVVFIHFHSSPYTSRESIEKTENLAKILDRFQFGSKLYFVPFADIQKEILLKTPDKLRVILYRRFMLRIAEEIAKKEKASVLVTGESVGQVASQTLENIRAIAESVKIPVLRPLICQDKIEIIRKAKEIGTFDISILPHEDCCARFLPRHPATKAYLRDVKFAEKELDVKKLIKKAVERTKKILI